MSDIMHINAVYDWNCGIVGKMAYGDSIETTTNPKDVTCPDCLALKMEHEFGKYTPSFPLVKFANENNIMMQYHHINSELVESWFELRDMNYSNMAIELLDAMHSIETALHILATKHGIDINEAKAAVIKKNRDRGYYK